ncbi:hypothetical protein H2204_009939 [Knufia peltigerae]|uniref:Uncharacterized protein n=1 Tax=Knufia peltigerae TaxID=1002370 RepID=A0AA38XXH1_9EURO|nr:hypothetical protein H2204_009939 [Knufia peltigerae]
MSRPQPVQTATRQNSIWKPLSEDNFRRDLVALSLKCNQVPIKPRLWLPATSDAAHHDKSWSNNARRQLSFDVERRLADDVAYILAAKEGVGSVTAVCVEENHEPEGLIFRVAANEGVNKEFKAGLGHICELLMSCARDGTPSFRRGNHTLKLVISDSPNSALASLRQTARGPAGQDLSRRLSRLKIDFEEFLRRSESLSAIDEMYELQVIVKKCFSVTTRDGEMSFWNTLSSAGISPKKWFNNKFVMQIDKLAAYHRIPVTLVKDVRKRGSRALFTNITPLYLESYASKWTTISAEGKRVKCHVHAEVQIITHYLKSQPPPPPRIPPRFIGTSKAACFLCHLFIESHGAFMVSATHGRLYDQWTIPDLADYSSEVVKKLRGIIALMDDECRRLVKEKHGRAFPLTSRHNLRDFPRYSPVASSVMSQQQQQQPHMPAIGEAEAVDEAVFEKLDLKSDMVEDIVSQSNEKDERKVDQIASNPSDSSSTLRSGPSTQEVRIEPDQPQYIDSIPGINISLEVETPSIGMAQFRKVSATNGTEHVSNLVKLEDLRLGDEMYFVRPEDQDHVGLRIIGKGERDLCFLRLRWI